MVTGESMRQVRPEHLNHHGFLFGGTLLNWLDEHAYMAAASVMLPEANLVTVGIDRVEFKHPVKLGTILNFKTRIAHVGRTSLTVFVDVYHGRGVLQHVFSAYVTFVPIGADTKPVRISDTMDPNLEPVTRDTLDSDGKAMWDEVEAQRRSRNRPKQTFMDKCFSGTAKPYEVHNYVAAWHNGKGFGELHEFLGLTPKEYSDWVELKVDFEAILSSKQF